MNKVMLTGRMTAAPELRSTASGKYVCDFSLAVDRLTQNGEKQVDFINCQAWGKQAENLCKYKGKGDKIGVVGAVRVEQYKGKDGRDRTKIFVLVIEIEYLDTRKAEAKVAVEPDAAQDKVVVDEPSDYPLDLPF